MSIRLSVRTLLASVTAWLALVGFAQASEPSISEAVVNAPVATVWAAFTTAEGYRDMGSALADVELRIDGRVRTRAEAQGVLGDAGTLVQAILAYDPQRMLALRVLQAPAGFPQGAPAMQTWTVIYFNSIADVTTHVRIVSHGYDDNEPVSQAARAAYEKAHREMLERLVKRYRPSCAHCERPQ